MICWPISVVRRWSARIDSKKIDRRGFKFRPRGERPAQDRRASNDIGKSPADAHDFGGVSNPLEIAAAGCFHAGVFWRDQQIAVARTKLRAAAEWPRYSREWSR